MLQKPLLILFSALVLSTSSWLTGCQALGVYTIDLPQGNPITRSMAAQLKLGMSPAQVRYVVGSPMVTDTFNPDRWDYVYNFKPGTYAKQSKISEINQHLTLYFSDGKLARIEGIDTLPEKSQLALPSKDNTLKAEPL